MTQSHEQTPVRISMPIVFDACETCPVACAHAEKVLEDEAERIFDPQYPNPSMDIECLLGQGKPKNPIAIRARIELDGMYNSILTAAEDVDCPVLAEE